MQSRTLKNICFHNIFIHKWASIITVVLYYQMHPMPRHNNKPSNGFITQLVRSLVRMTRVMEGVCVRKQLPCILPNRYRKTSLSEHA